MKSVAMLALFTVFLRPARAAAYATCAAGEHVDHLDGGAVRCLPCAAGRYQPTPSAARCSLCPAGRTSPPGSALRADCTAPMAGVYLAYGAGAMALEALSLAVIYAVCARIDDSSGFKVAAATFWSCTGPIIAVAIVAWYLTQGREQFADAAAAELEHVTERRELTYRGAAPVPELKVVREAGGPEVIVVQSCPDGSDQWAVGDEASAEVFNRSAVEVEVRVAKGVAEGEGEGEGDGEGGEGGGGVALALVVEPGANCAVRARVGQVLRMATADGRPLGEVDVQADAHVYVGLEGASPLDALAWPDMTGQWAAVQGGDPKRRFVLNFACSWSFALGGHGVLSCSNRRRYPVAVAGSVTGRSVVLELRLGGQAAKELPEAKLLWRCTAERPNVLRCRVDEEGTEIKLKRVRGEKKPKPKPKPAEASKAKAGGKTKLPTARP